MPICTVDNNRDGSELSCIAIRAPVRPRRAIASSRALRADTIDSSAIANSPLIRMRIRMTATSIHGNGARGGLFIVLPP